MKNLEAVDFFHGRKCIAFTREEEQKIFRKYRAAKSEEYKTRLRNQIIEHNLGLVRIIARKFLNGKNAQFEAGDLMSEGVFGLMSAIDKFDPDRGYKFSTIAYYWIKQKMQYAIALNPTNYLRVPTETMKKYNENVEMKGKRDISIEMATMSLVSLDKSKITVNGDLQSMEVSDTREDFTETVERNIRSKHLQMVMKRSLHPRSFVIVNKYLNSHGDNATLKSVGDEMGLTRERIRQIVTRAIKDTKFAMRGYERIGLPAEN